MEKIFITNLVIDEVRHLRDIKIPVSKNEMKHLLFTGKNGSGKTSLLDEMAKSLYLKTIYDKQPDTKQLAETNEESSQYEKSKNRDSQAAMEAARRLAKYAERIEAMRCGVTIEMNQTLENITSAFEKGEFISAYYKADRVFQAQIPKHVEKVELKDNYSITESPSDDFIKYLLDLKMTEALAVSGGKQEKADGIKRWFGNFQDMLQRIFEEKDLRLEFDEDTFRFSIHIPGRQPFDFNMLSSGYAAVLDIVVDLIMRMEKHTGKNFNFNLPGIVLIDEIETHLHLELQKKILRLLTAIFPNIQFVVSTHSPFILNSLENAVIYDLENHVLVENGLVDIPYSGIVEGYFKADTMSDLLREKYERYKALVHQSELTDENYEEIAKLEMFLEEIPDYLALDLTTEYRRLKLEFESREDA